MPHSVDVLVCTHNDSAHIGRLLDSLEHQTVGPMGFGVIVIDNASDDGTGQLLKQRASGLNLRAIVEPRLGLNYARNSGYDNSRADYVAHIDADAVAHSKWIEHIQDVLDQMQPDLCGGPYFPYYLLPKPSWFEDRYNSNYLGNEAHWLGPNEYLSGTNMIWRRELVANLGGFKTEAGFAGPGWTPGDETELIARARHTNPGFRIYYDPEITVYHLTRSEAFMLTNCARRYFLAGARESAVFGRSASSSNLEGARLAWRAARAAFHILVGFAIGLVARNRQQYPFYENYVYERLLPHAAVLGQAYTAFLTPNGQ